MLTYIKHCCCIAIIVAVAGCYKDKGNYDYIDINQVAIASDSNNIVVVQQDTLRIRIQLQQSMPDAAGLDYEWVLYPDNSAPQTRRKLGTTKDLSAMISEKPGNYVLDYFVTDRKTGVSFQKRFSISVESAFGEGWMILEENGGTTDLSLVTRGKKIFRNIYSTSNKGEKLPAGTSLVNIIQYRGQEIYLLSPADMIQVDYIDFTKIMRFDQFFFAAPAPKPEGHYLLGGSDKILYNNGQVYAVSTILPPPFTFGLPLIGASGSPYYMEPYPIYSVSKGKIFYDRNSQRFYRAGSYDIELFPFPGYNPAVDAFNMNDIGKKLLYAEHNVTDVHNVLFKNNNNDSLFVYAIDAGLENPAIAKYDVTGVPGLLGADHYRMSKTLTYLYYSNGNKVYKLDILAQSSTLLYTFPAGTNVADIKMYYNTSQYDDPDNNRLLAVATNEGGHGKLYHFPIAVTGNFEGNTYRTVFDGFGKINGIAYKSGN
ncbi:PKD-like family lipoprotein [Chitinophaga rhizosphaerae]|uniref:PKD-like family lipoprotein n=1 Tax=Chitinophaga rhizosphaerae TaxID=1864947 RepID=UPI000F802141|nr:PKD-like family lipoprotein [Chitinophaga rhizosphaerae]